MGKVTRVANGVVYFDGFSQVQDPGIANVTTLKAAKKNAVAATPASPFLNSTNPPTQAPQPRSRRLSPDALSADHDRRDRRDGHRDDPNRVDRRRDGGDGSPAIPKRGSSSFAREKALALIDSSSSLPLTKPFRP